MIAPPWAYASGDCSGSAGAVLPDSQESVFFFNQFWCFAAGFAQPILHSYPTAHRKANECSGSNRKRKALQPPKSAKTTLVRFGFLMEFGPPSMRTDWYCFLSLPANYFEPTGRELESGRRFRRAKMWN